MKDKDPGRPPLFGVSKDTAVLVITVLLALLLAVDTGGLWKLEQIITANAILSKQGAESHAALCTLRAEDVQSIAQTKTFLALSHHQLVVKYGTAIADIPRTTYIAQLHRQEAAARALHLTGC